MRLTTEVKLSRNQLMKVIMDYMKRIGMSPCEARFNIEERDSGPQLTGVTISIVKSYSVGEP